MFNFDLLQLVLWLPAVIIAITFHEYAHGRAADWLGDPTPRYQGRLTLNPLAHLDPLGFVLLLFVHFGWAKPVQVNPVNFRGNMRKGMMLVSLAGPGMNLLIAFTAMLIKDLALPTGAGGYLPAILDGTVFINIYLALFNLIPVPPLDGSKVLAGLIHNQDFIYALERYGYAILIALILFGVVGGVIGPLADYVYNLFDIVSKGIAHFIIGP